MRMDALGFASNWTVSRALAGVGDDGEAYNLKRLHKLTKPAKPKPKAPKTPKPTLRVLGKLLGQLLGRYCLAFQ
jgi:hypothetical protein